MYAKLTALLLCRALLLLFLQVLSPGGRLTTLIVRLPSSVSAAAAANSILVQSNELLAQAAAAAGSSSSSSASQQPRFGECHLLAYTTSRYEYPQRKPQQGFSSNPGASSAAAGQPAPAGGVGDDQVLQQHVTAFKKRRDGLLAGRAQLREVDAAEQLHEPWWFQNELLVLLFPTDPAAAAGEAAADVRVGSKRPAASRGSEEEQQAQQLHVLVLQSVEGSGNDWSEGTQMLPLLLTLPSDLVGESIVRHAMQVGAQDGRCMTSICPPGCLEIIPWLFM